MKVMRSFGMISRVSHLTAVGDRPSRSSRSVARSFVTPALIFLALALAVLFGVVWLGNKQDAVRAMPPETRVQLLQHGLDELRSICRTSYAASGPVRDRCIQQASFVLLLPECDTACRTAATAIVPRARR